MREMAWRMEITGEASGAELWLHKAAERGEPNAIRELALRFERAGRQAPEVVALWRRLADQGDRLAKLRLSRMLDWDGHPEEAAELWRRDAQAGDEFALCVFAEYLAAAGLIGRAAPVFRRAVSKKPWSKQAVHVLVDLLTEAGRDHEAEAWLRKVASDGSTAAAQELAWRLERGGKITEAEFWLSAAIEGGSESAPWSLHNLLVRDGRNKEANAVLQRAANCGLDSARYLLMRKLMQPGREADLEIWSHAVIEESGPDEIRQHARLLEQKGQADLAINVWRAAAERGDYHARWRLVQLLEKVGRAAEAESWLRALIADGRDLLPTQKTSDPEEREDLHDGETSARQATRVLAALLHRQGRIDEGLTLLRRNAEEGDWCARRDLEQMMEHVEHWPRRVAEQQSQKVAVTSSSIQGTLASDEALAALREKLFGGQI